jgi:tetratricopeptide (TPR) repeat protein
MGKTLAELALTGFAALGIFGTPYVGAQPAAPVPAPLEAPKPPQEQKQPLPSDEDMKKAETDIREVYKAEYQVKDPAKKQEFANKLLDQALQIKNGSDLPTKCVLLREAYLMSTNPDGLETAFKAANALNDSFQTVDLTEMKSNALVTAQKVAKTQKDLEILANNYVPVIDEALTQDKYDNASTMAKSLKTVATSLKNKDLVDKAVKYEKDIPALKTEYNTAAKALETLTQNPADPSANLTYGKFLAKKGDWDKAMEYFFKTSDVDLQEAAKAELLVKSGNAEADTYMKAAEKWEAIGKKNKGIDQERFFGRAVECYQNALSSTTNPIAKAKIEKKLKEFEGKTATQNGLVNLLALIDPQKDAVKGAWKLEGAKLITPVETRCSSLQLPYVPPEEYDLKVVLEQKDKPGGVYIGLVAGENQFGVELDGYTLEPKPRTRVYLIDGKSTGFPGADYTGKLFEKNKPSTVVCSVRKSQLTVSVDGKTVINLKNPDYAKFSRWWEWSVSNPRALSIGAYDITYQIHQIMLTPTRGTGKPTR